MPRTISGRLANFRDLGGLATEDGRMTRPGVLYRSDAPFPGDTPPGVPAWPPAVILDLRSSAERTAAHPLAGDKTVIHSLPLLADARPPSAGDVDAIETFRLGSLYPRIAERAAAALPLVLDRITSSPGPALVHCSAGKDRTGVLIALLLRAAGVTSEAIVADYVRTASAMQDVLSRLRFDVDLKSLTESTDALSAPAVAITTVLDPLDRHHNGVAGWLHDHGVERHAVDRWRDRLLG